MMTNVLNRTSVLEALFECLSDDKLLYDQFCDRLDAQMVPFLSMINGVQKLEYPLPMNHVFSVKEGGSHVNYQIARNEALKNLPLHPRR